MPIWLRIVIFLLLIGLAEYYSFLVVRSAVRSFSPAVRTTTLIIYGAVSALCWAGILAFRAINWAAMPHFVRNLYIAFVLGFFVGKLLVLAVMLIDDLRRFVLYLISLFYTGGTKPMPLSEQTAPEVVKGSITRSVFLARVALALGGSALFGFLYGVTNRYRYKLHRVPLAFAHLPEAFRGLRIVQLSDIHSGSFDNPDAVAKGVQAVMDLKPDLILFTGDLVNNKAEEIEPYKEIFSRLQAPLGVFSTLGNHDYADYVAEWSDQPDLKRKNLDRLKQHHADMGWRLLMNEHVLLEKGGQQIALIGIENWSAKLQFRKYGRMDAAYAGLPEKNVPFKILMSHDPSHWDAQVTQQYKDVDLTLSGHTHGMQFGVEIPGLRIKWSPVKYVYKNWAGLYQDGKQFLYVNRGFGFLGYPGRLGILPEITLFELS